MKLLEITHGQWLYRNVQVNDAVSGLKAVERKEELQKEIEHQILLGQEKINTIGFWPYELQESTES